MKHRLNPNKLLYLRAFFREVEAQYQYICKHLECNEPVAYGLQPDAIDLSNYIALIEELASQLQSGEIKSSDLDSRLVEHSITIGSYAQYAQIHNEGGTIHIPITPKMKKYFWAMYQKTKDEKWKYMALTKKQNISLKFPKRQFMGYSATLMKILDEELKKYIEKSFKP